MKKFLQLAAFSVAFMGVVTSLKAQSELALRFDDNAFRRNTEVDASLPVFLSDDVKSLRADLGGVWTLQLSSDAVYDTNAFRNETGTDDWHWDYAAGLNYEWWATPDVVITPGFSAGGQRFDRYEELDGDELGVGVDVALPNLPLPLVFTYNSSWGFESDFGDHNFTAHTFGLQVVLGKIQLAESTSLTTQATGSYQFTDPSFLDAASVGLSARFQHVVIKDKLNLSALTAVAYRSFTDFGPVDRDTWRFTAGVNLEWKICKDFAAVLGVNYTHAEDSIDRFDHDQVLSFVSLRLTSSGFHFLGLPRYKAPQTKYGDAPTK